MKGVLTTVGHHNPVPGDSVSGWTTTDDGKRTFERIMARTPDEVGYLSTQQASPRHGRLRIAGATAAITIIAIFGATFLLGGSDDVLEGSDDERLPAASDIDGVWLLVSFDVANVSELIEPGVNTARQPWIEIGASLRGNAGCNDFESLVEESFSFVDGMLEAGAILQDASACIEDGSSLMNAENVFLGVVGDSTKAIAVERLGDEMIWVAGDTRLVFNATPTAPTVPTPSPNQALGRLDCTPGFIEETISVTSQEDPTALMKDAAEEVVSVEAEPPSFWWGYNRNDQVVAAVLMGDVQPPTYQILTCSEQEP